MPAVLICQFGCCDLLSMSTSMSLRVQVCRVGLPIWKNPCDDQVCKVLDASFWTRVSDTCVCVCVCVSYAHRSPDILSMV